jgi:hypothetical protein
MRYQITGIAEYGYMLVLNSMMGPIEGSMSFGPYHDLATLKAFYDGEKVEPYNDEGLCLYEGGKKMYSKTFRKGGPLEWCNALKANEIDWDNVEGSCNCFGHGTHLRLMEVTQVERQFRLA